MDDFLSSDDDLEIVEYIDSDFFNRRVGERIDHFNLQRDKAFHRRFRLEKENVLYLLNKIEHKLIQPTHNR